MQSLDLGSSRVAVIRPHGDAGRPRPRCAEGCANVDSMCRSIVTLRGDEEATAEEVEAAALQFVRKVSGHRTPSRANQAAFERAVNEVAEATQRLLDHLVVAPGSKPPPMARSRVVAREKRARVTPA